jgi:hypothetical protein
MLPLEAKQKFTERDRTLCTEESATDIVLVATPLGEEVFYPSWRGFQGNLDFDGGNSESETSATERPVGALSVWGKP